MMAGADGRGCLWCGGPLPKGRRKYCSDQHGYEYFIHHIEPLWWPNACRVALGRAGHKCEVIGCDGRPLEVHHIIPLRPGEPRWNSPKNAQINLMVLCRAHHEAEHHPIVAGAMERERLQGRLPLFA